MRFFTGDFDLLPIRCSLTLAPVPPYPTGEDLQNAACAASGPELGTWDRAATRWRLEAIRERRLRPGAPLDAGTLDAIAQRVATKLYAEALEADELRAMARRRRS